MTVKEKQSNEELLVRIKALEERLAARIKSTDEKMARMMTVICNLAPISNLARDKLRKHFEGKV